MRKLLLDSADRRRLNAAEGWLGLGNWADAEQELEAISPQGQGYPEVLQVKWAICAAAKNWAVALEVAAALIQTLPEDASSWVHRSYCLHELKRTQEARDNLLRVVGQFKDDPTVQYNLA